MTIFEGKTLKLSTISGGLVELRWDRVDGSVNLIDNLALTELSLALDALQGMKRLEGLLIASAKPDFIVGADIGEFKAIFSMPAEKLIAKTCDVHRLFCRLEDLACPTVAAINGYALGGGLELALCADSRVMAQEARIGLPEMGLGIYPAYGGTVRLSRLAQLPIALRWIIEAGMHSAAQALQAGVVDASAPGEQLRDSAIRRLQDLAEGKFDWRAERARRRKPLPESSIDDASCWDVVNIQADRARQRQHLPAAHVTLGMMRQAVRLERDAALVCEASHFPEVAQSAQAAALIRIYGNEQDVKRQVRRWVGPSPEVLTSIGVAGAGTMGSGLALAAAMHGSQVQVADVSPRSLESGASYVRAQLERQTKAGKRSMADQQAIEKNIRWQATLEGWETCDLAIEAVIEDLQTKVQLLQGIESRVTPHCVIATNTSSLLVTDLAREMVNPERFVGLHFFNPVPAMPLVEVVRTAQTSPQALARASSWVRQMKKTPIVVADCPGFLVNRIVTPYLRSFVGMIAEGIDPYRIDRLMQDYGWPMGPATLEDVIGLDTGARVLDIIAAGYSDRMPSQDSNILHQLASQGWLGRKSGAGFYDYSTPAAPQANPKAVDFIAKFQQGRRLELDDQAIVQRMMLPLWLEAALCLREGVAQSAAEIDIALLMGLGYPRYLGGALHQIDQIGWTRIEAMVAAPQRLGQEYRLTKAWQGLFGVGGRFYP